LQLLVATEPLAIVAPLWRFPNAKPQIVQGDWWVACGQKKQAVIPRGVFADPSWDLRPLTLQKSISQVLDDLLEIATDLTPEKQASHLAGHVAQFGMPDLCGEHGLPRYHYSPYLQDLTEGREQRRLGISCPRPQFPGRQTPGVNLSHVIRFINFLDGLKEAGEQIGAGHPVRARVVEDLLALPLLPGPPRLATAAPEQATNTNLTADQVRNLVQRCMDAAMHASGVDLATTWASKRRPQITLRSNTNVGLYVIATVERIGIATQDEVFSCSYCEEGYTPKRHPRPGERRTCGRPECQNRRQADNQRNYVSRRK
jgi:hypothetical protein